MIKKKNLWQGFFRHVTHVNLCWREWVYLKIDYTYCFEVHMPQTYIIFLSYIFSKEAQSVYCNEAFTFLFKMFVCRNTALKLFMPSNILLLLMWPCSSFARNIILFNWNNNQRFHALLCSTGKTDCEMCDKIKPFEKHWYFKEWLKL